MKNIVGNWAFSPIYTDFLQADVQSALDANLNHDIVVIGVVFNPSGIPGTGNARHRFDDLGWQCCSLPPNNPSAQYIVAGAGALATIAAIPDQANQRFGPGGIRT